MITNLITLPTQDYHLLDSGNFQKLEQIGPYLIERPCAQALWTKQKPLEEWAKAMASAVRHKDGSGQWKTALPVEHFQVRFTIGGEEVIFQLKLTSFGHVGLFFEQIPLWEKLFHLVKALKQIKKQVTVVNLFGYTGAASVVMAMAGAKVIHVDSARGVLDWTLTNFQLNKIPSSQYELIHQDARSFLQEQLRKKERSLDGLLADPPTFGHGAKKEVWKFEEHFQEFFFDCVKVLNKEQSFLLFSSHTPGVQAASLNNVFLSSPYLKQIEYGDLHIAHQDEKRLLAQGVYALAQQIQKN